VERNEVTRNIARYRFAAVCLPSRLYNVLALRARDSLTYGGSLPQFAWLCVGPCFFRANFVAMRFGLYASALSGREDLYGNVSYKQA
jgi:hypothetical protein